MQITPKTERIADAITRWALAEGWKTVGVKISEEYHRRGGGPILPEARDELSIHNAKQKVARIFTLSGPRYRQLAVELEDVVLAALPTKERLKIEEPDSLELATARALEEMSGLISALILRCPTAAQKLCSTMEGLQTLVPVIQQLAFN